MSKSNIRMQPKDVGSGFMEEFKGLKMQMQTAAEF